MNYSGVSKLRLKAIFSFALLFCGGLPLLAQDSLRVRSISTIFQDLPETGGITSIGIKDDYAIVADPEFGIRIVDLSNINVLREVGRCEIEHGAGKVAIVGDYCYVIGYIWTTFAVVDISDIENPQLVYFTNLLSASFGDITVEGSYSFLAGVHREQLRIYDVSDPHSPAVIDSLQLPRSSIYCIEKIGDNVFICGKRNNEDRSFLSVIDVQDPSNLVEIAQISLNIDGYVSEITSRGNYLYLAGPEFFLTIDVSNASEPAIRGSLIGFYTNIVASHERCYTTIARNPGVSILNTIDVSYPDRPRIVNSLEGLSDTEALFLNDTTLFVGELVSLKIYDIRERDHPEYVTAYVIPSGPESFSINAGYCYVGTNHSLRILDIGDLDHLFEVNQLAIGHGQTQNIVVVDSLCYMGNGEEVYLINIANPELPSIMSEFHLPNSIRSLTVVQQKCYVLTNLDILYVYDLSSPENPQILGSYDLPGIGTELVISENICYVASQSSGLYILDVSDEENIFEIGSIPISTWGVTYKDGICYLSTGSGGLQLVDVSTPDEPRLVNTEMRVGEVRNSTISGNHCFTASGEDGFYVVDIQNPRGLWLGGFYRSGRSALSVQIYNDLAYVLESNYIAIYDYEDALTEGENNLPIVSEFRLDAPYPNPFNGVVGFSIHLPEACYINVQASDVIGRTIDNIAGGYTRAGTYPLQWNPNGLGSGKYFINITTSEGMKAIQPVVLIR